MTKISVKHVIYVLLGINCFFILFFFSRVSSPEEFTANTQAFTNSRQTAEDQVQASDNDPDDTDDSDSKDDTSIDIDLDDQKDEIKKERKKKSHSKSHKKGSKKSKKSSKEDKSYKKKAKANRAELKEIKKELDHLQSELSHSSQRVTSLEERRTKVGKVLRYSNPFFLLGAYPRIGNEYFNSYPDGRPYYEKFNYGLINDEDYCEMVDLYNIAHPENMFDTMNFFTDYSRTGLTRGDVIRKIGVDTMRQVSRYMEKPDFNSAQYHLTPIITNYFTKRVDLHIYHTIGKHFNCATQMYNHIPGHGVLKRKDLIVDSVDSYATRFEDGREQCFNKKKFFPYSYRLYMENECKAFFEHINSDAYLASLEKEPIQFVIKLGYGAHRAKGVFIFDKNETEIWREFYDDGNKCGAENKSIIAQTYITNPLLLDKNNKFDFRVYMLVASTNPLIVYYHDGFLRVSLEVYDKHSSDKSVHLTNTHLSKEKFAEAEANNSTINGMTAQELRDYQMWSFQRLGEHLYNSGKVDDPNWVENNLKPRFYEAFIHTVRMSAHAFWNQSNVYEMFGLDFMLDEELNLWFIECNSSPQLIGTNEHKTKFLIQMLEDLFEIQYGLYRSRMKRVLEVFKRINTDSAENGSVDYSIWRDAYAEASRNRFEPEYEVNPTNSFKLIMDLNKSGKEAFFGNLPDECTY
jgi:hypothetical protein